MAAVISGDTSALSSGFSTPQPADATANTNTTMIPMTTVWAHGHGLERVGEQYPHFGCLTSPSNLTITGHWFNVKYPNGVLRPT